MAGENYNYNGSYRLGLTQIALADFDSDYELEKFPRQDDQPAIVDWLPPLNGSDVFEEFIEQPEAMDGTADTFGNGAFDWFTGYWSPLMVRYFMDTYFANGSGWARVTVMTFDAGYGWRVVWAIMRRPRLSEAERVGYGYNRIRISFVDAIEAA